MKNEIEVKANKPKDYPCKDCADRHAGCHAECAAYLEARAQNQAANREARKNIEKDLDYVRFVIESLENGKKRKRKAKM